jgi:hypothetical protein
VVEATFDFLFNTKIQNFVSDHPIIILVQFGFNQNYFLKMLFHFPIVKTINYCGIHLEFPINTKKGTHFVKIRFWRFFFHFPLVKTINYCGSHLEFSINTKKKGHILSKLNYLRFFFHFPIVKTMNCGGNHLEFTIHTKNK